MVWVIGAICMIFLFGAAAVFIGLYLPVLAYAIVGGILVVVGILLLVSFRRSGGPFFRYFWGLKWPLASTCQPGGAGEPTLPK